MQNNYQEKLDEVFSYLKEYPTCEGFKYEHDNGTELRIIPVKKFINGMPVAEGEAFPKASASFEDAAKKTKDTIDNIISNYKNIYIRIMPQHHLDANGHFVRVRLAYYNDVEDIVCKT